MVLVLILFSGCPNQPTDGKDNGNKTQQDAYAKALESLSVEVGSTVNFSPQELNSKEDFTEIKNKLSSAMEKINETEKEFGEKEELTKYKEQLNSLLESVNEFEKTRPAFVMPENVSGEISFEEAKKIVTENLVDALAETKPVIYAKEEMLEEGTEVSHYGKKELDNLVWKTTDKAWFFWIDDAPNAEFAHPTRYVFVKNSGEYIVFKADFWPEINNERFFGSQGTEIVYGNFSSDNLGELIQINFAEKTLSFEGEVVSAFTPRTPCPCNKPSETYAIIIQASPGVEADGRVMSFGTNADGVNDMVKGNGISPDNIEFLADPTNTGADVDSAANVANIKAAVNKIKGKIKCCDELFVYLTTHGGLVCDVTWTNGITGGQTEETLQNSKCPNRGDSSWGIWVATSVNYRNWFSIPGAAGEKDPWASDFADIFDGIDNCNTSFMFQSCHSGGVIPELQGKGRTITTSADIMHSSFAGNPGDPSPVTEGFLNGMNGANGADSDGDGSVSLEEGMNFGKNNFTGGNSYPEFWQSTEACDCPPKICDENIIIDDSNNNIDDTTSVSISDAWVLVDGNASDYIDLNPDAWNHIVVTSDSDFVLPFTITLSGDGYSDDYVISDPILDCANTKKCSTDIDTTNMVIGITTLTASIDSEFSTTFTVSDSSASCNEEWQCIEWSSWSACLNSTQTRTRTCTDANTCGTTTNKPDETESQNCEECVESWSCDEFDSWSDWSACSEQGIQTRTRTKECSDENSCGTTVNKPETTETETQNCEYAPTEQKAEYTAHENVLGDRIYDVWYDGVNYAFDTTEGNGEWGIRIQYIPAGTTIKVCVAAEQPLSFVYYPQYHYGFDFTDTDPGCTEIYNKNTWANGVLVHLGDPTPVNTAGIITVTLLGQ